VARERERVARGAQVVVGERFSFSLDHEGPGLLYLHSGSLAILVWKAGSLLLKVL
jgi:hypothetical protein